MITKTQYNKLQKYEVKLRQAYYGRVLCACGSNFVENIIRIYNEVFNANKHYTNCDKCVFNIVYALAEKYFEYEKKNNVEKKKKDE